ncbi:MAG: hypothetical protein LC720_09225 [Actinobacteria bacterium]|nr:hypothetical protein [Actinomycetota bacterium]
MLAQLMAAERQQELMRAAAATSSRTPAGRTRRFVRGRRAPVRIRVWATRTLRRAG